MDIAHIESVEGNRVVTAAGSFWVACLAIFFCFSELDNDRNAEKFLSGQLNDERTDSSFLNSMQPTLLTVSTGG